MPGMGTGRGSVTSTALAIAFHRSILHQWFIILGMLAALFAVWNFLRLAAMKSQTTRHPVPLQYAPSSLREPSARRFLRVAFGGLWLFDGLLQSQSAIPAALANTVIKPVAASSPAWAALLSNHAISVWNDHPVTTATAVFWMEIGLGIWLLSASRGPLSRFAGYASASWALVVWVFAEVFGGLFAPGYSWLFGAPGAALAYLVAGVLVGLPDRCWRSSLLGLALLRALGAFLIAMAALQAWPNRGFWEGRRGDPSVLGTLPAMLSVMKRSSQPGFSRSLVAHMANLSASHGFAINLVVVLVLGLAGIALLTTVLRDGRARTARGWIPLLPVVIVYLAASLVVWVSIQDFGLFGGVGTDPNSMIPIAFILVSALLATKGSPLPTNDDLAPVHSGARNFVETLRSQVVHDPNQSIRTFVSFGGLFVILLGAISMISAL